MLRLLPKIEGFGGIPGSEAYQIKNEYAQRRRLRRKINSTSKSEVSSTWAPLPHPKEMKASLSKVQAFKLILPNASKLSFSNLQSLNSILSVQSWLFFCPDFPFKLMRLAQKDCGIFLHTDPEYFWKSEFGALIVVRKLSCKKAKGNRKFFLFICFLTRRDDFKVYIVTNYICAPIARLN